ncbi:MAG: hypothetical protein H6958_08200 [Chromatiaceae bacterium]|nr:hypothetical protein [Chromatiaceae bacterium]
MHDQTRAMRNLWSVSRPYPLIMTKHRLSLALFLAFALFSSQCLLAAHGHHDDWLHPDPDCQLCQHMVQFSAFAATAPALQPVFLLLESTVESPPSRVHANRARLYESRAPPVPC